MKTKNLSVKELAAGSSDQRNTIWGTVELEGDRMGHMGRPGLSAA